MSHYPELLKAQNAGESFSYLYEYEFGKGKRSVAKLVAHHYQSRGKVYYTNNAETISRFSFYRFWMVVFHIRVKI